MKFLKTTTVIAMLAAVLSGCVNLSPQNEIVIVSTFVGDIKEGFADGRGSAARFNEPSGIAIDAVGNFYVADEYNHRICKVTPNGEVSTLAGGGEGGFADGQGRNAQFLFPRGIAVDAAGNLYVVDNGNHRIRKITPEGEVSVLAGGGPAGFYGGGFADGEGSVAWFHHPSGITIDAAGNLYVADTWNHSIRRVTPNGEVSTLAGDAEHDFADGEGSSARFNYPHGIAIDATGNLYVADYGNNRIRKVTPAGEVSTLAGGGDSGFADGQGENARFDAPSGIAIDVTGNLYVADNNNNHIRKVTPKGEVSTLAGGRRGFADGQGSEARFRNPDGIVVDATGNLYVADQKNNRIRKIEICLSLATCVSHPSLSKAGIPNEIVTVSTLAGGNEQGGFADGQGSAARFFEPIGIAVDTVGNLYVADERNNRIRIVTPSGEVSTLAGGEEGFADGQGSTARFNRPSGIAIDAVGNLYVTDYYNDRIRKVTPNGEVSTLAGGKEGFADGEGSAARFYAPSGIAIDAVGNLYVTDYYNNRIRKVTPNGEVSTLAGGEKGFADGEGSAARFYAPSGIAVDAAGNLYVADYGNNRIRKVTPAGEVSTLAGDGIRGFADGQGRNARFDLPKGITIDAADTLYVADYLNDRIRKVTLDGEVSTLAGGGDEENPADGQGRAARFGWPSGIAVDAAGNLYVTDGANNRNPVDRGKNRIRKIEFRRP